MGMDSWWSLGEHTGLRELGNLGAHPIPGQLAPDPNDDRDIVRFLDFLLECVYTLPHRTKQYRERNKQQ